jgi:hypothetical protein
VPLPPEQILELGDDLLDHVPPARRPPACRGGPRPPHVAVCQCRSQLAGTTPWSARSRPADRRQSTGRRSDTRRHWPGPARRRSPPRPDRRPRQACSRTPRSSSRRSGRSGPPQRTARAGKTGPVRSPGRRSCPAPGRRRTGRPVPRRGRRDAPSRGTAARTRRLHRLWPGNAGNAACRWASAKRQASGSRRQRGHSASTASARSSLGLGPRQSGRGRGRRSVDSGV